MHDYEAPVCHLLLLAEDAVMTSDELPKDDISALV